MSYDVLQEIVDAAFPTSGTTGPNAWTDERIRVRARFAGEAERILAPYEAAVEALERFETQQRRHGLSQLLNEKHAAFLPARDALSDALAALARLREKVPANPLLCPDCGHHLHRSPPGVGTVCQWHGCGCPAEKVPDANPA